MLTDHPTLCVIHLKTISKAVLMKVICDMRSEIAQKISLHLPGAKDLQPRHTWINSTPGFDERGRFMLWMY